MGIVAMILLALFVVISLFVLYLFVGALQAGRYRPRTERTKERNHRRYLLERDGAKSDRAEVV